MKKIFVLIFLMFTISSISQVTNEGNPLSWDLNLSVVDVAVKSLPQFDMDQVKAEDIINDQKPGTPWRFGYTHSVDYGLNDGTWSEWKMAIGYGDY